jgi:hypothetical protein
VNHWQMSELIWGVILLIVNVFWLILVRGRVIEDITCNILDFARKTHFHSPAHTKEKPPAMHPGVPTVFRNTHTHASSGLYPQLLGIQKP